MKKHLFLTFTLFLSVHLNAQIRCEDVKCITEEQMRYEADDSGNEIIKIEDMSNPISIVVFDTLGNESEMITYSLIPFTGCVKTCNEGNSGIYLNEISYYEYGKRQGPSLVYGYDGDVMSKGHYFNNNKIGEHIRYGKNREITQRVNYDQFGKKHGEEMILRGDEIEFILYEHGKSIRTTTKKVKKK